MSNSGLECVGSCLQCCSEYQRGEARRGTPPCAAANLPHREGSRRSCAGTGPRRACNPLPQALTPTVPSPWMEDGSQDLVLPAALPTSARSRAGTCTGSSFPVQHRQEPSSFQMEEKPLITQFQSLLGGQTDPPHCCRGKSGTWGAPTQPRAPPPSPGCYLLQPRAAAMR